MKLPFLAATALAGGLSAFAPAHAGEKSIRLFGGVGLQSEFDGSATYAYEGTVVGGATGSDAFDAGASADLESGFVVGAAFGVTRGDFLFEGEIAQRTAEISELSFTEGGATFTNDAAEGESVAVTSVMANVWWELDMSPKWTAHVGLGGGLAQGDVADFDGGTAFAWQAGFGLRRSLTPRISAGVAYRYFSAADLIDDETSETFGTPGVATSTVTETLAADFLDQSVLLDVVFRF